MYRSVTLCQTGGPSASQVRTELMWGRDITAVPQSCHSWSWFYFTLSLGSRATLQGRISRLKPTSSALSRLHCCPSLLSPGTHSKNKCDWTLRAASVSVPGMLAYRLFVLAPGPSSCTFGREVLVPSSSSSLESHPLYVMNRWLMGSFPRLASPVLERAEVFSNYSQAGSTVPSVCMQARSFYRGSGREC